MIFNEHSDLEGKHAFLSASNYHWLEYDDTDLERRYVSLYATTMGDVLHALAKDLIMHHIKLSKTDKKLVLLELLRAGIPRNAFDMERIFYNFMAYVNDAIGFGMSPEVKLVYTNFAFGTTDAIYFNEKTKVLIIHDYKSGTTKADIRQLLIYAALFCLEYGIKPENLNEITCRIYQNNEVLEHQPEPADINQIITKMVRSNQVVSKLYEEG